MTVPTLSLLLVLTFLVAIKVIACVAHKYSQRTILDFYITDRRTSCLMLVGTIVATMINTLAVTGVPALVYKGGILYIQMFAIGIIAPLLIYLFGSKIWKFGKENNVFTQAELFGLHYRSKTVQLTCAILGLLAIFPFMAVQLSAIGKVFSVATSSFISYELAVLISAFSIGAYLYLGGSRAVVWTDIVQSIVFLVIIVTSAVLFTYWSGGYFNGLQRLQLAIPEKLSFNTHNTPLLIDNILSWPFAFFLWPQLFQRMFMAKSERVVRQSVKWNFLFFNLIVLCTMTMGIMATGDLYGQVQDPDQLVAMMYNIHLPLGGAFIVVAVFATGMSTVDSILLTSSSIVSRDVLVALFPDRNFGFRIARYIAMFFLMIVTLFALSETGRGAMAPLVTLGASLATLFLWPLVGVFFWKSTSKEVVLLTLVVGFSSIVLTKFTTMGQALPIGSATVGFFVSLTVFVLGNLLCKGLYASRWSSSSYFSQESQLS